MEFRQPAQNPRPVGSPAASPVAAVTENGGSSFLAKLLTVFLILAAVTFVGVYVSRAIGSLSSASTIKGNEFQAVFLTNGQVYFGKVSDVDSSYVKLTNIYYLQVTSAASGSQTVQPKASDTSNQQVSLAKLGGELHGPEDTMFISRSQVLFWENLKTDGKVSKAIADYVAQGKK
jgi:hypothetical protein